MAYVTPKTNWAAGNIPVASDLNRIEGNTKANHDAIEAEVAERVSAVDAEEAARIAADSAESAARVAADNTNAGYHDGSTESALKIELFSSLPTPGAAYNGRMVRVEKTGFVAGHIYTGSNVYICLYARSDTVSEYTWVKIASYSI